MAATKIVDVSLTKKTGTVLTLNTKGRYVDDNLSVGINAPTAILSSSEGSADVEILSSDDGSIGGNNISNVIGTKTSSEPSTGYYIKVKASGSVSPSVTTPGWVDPTSLEPTSAESTKYFPITTAAITQNKPTINTSTGLVTATASTTQGYTPANNTADSNTLQLSTQGAATITPSESEQTAVAAGKYTTGIVKVGAINSSYVGSAVDRNDSEDLTISGATVTAPAGYYAENATVTIPNGSVTQNAPTVDSSTGVVTATSTVNAGYVTAGTKSNTLNLSTQAAKTVTPTESKQTAVDAGKYTTGKVEVAAISSSYVGSAIARNDSDDLTASAATVTAPAGYYAEDATKTIPNGSVTQNAPTVDEDGLVTAASTVTAGYVTAGTKSNTLQLDTKGAETYPFSTLSGATISAGQYLTGDQTILQAYTSGISSANIRYGKTVKVGDTANNTRIHNVSGTFTKANTVSSGQTAASASQIRSGYSAWVDGEEVKGSMQTRTISQGTTSVSGTTATRGIASIQEGYTTGETIPAATFANEPSSGESYVDISSTTSSPVLVSGDYLYINKGYTDNLKISLSKLVPDGSDVKGHGEYILSGHSAYDNDGTLIAGTIPTKTSADMTVSGKTVTAPAGYYASAQSKSVAVGTVTSGTANITSLSAEYNSTSGKFDISGSADVSAPTVNTAGYVSSSEGIKSAKSGGATVTATMNKIVGSTAITGTTTKKPSITKRDVPSGVIQAASGNATTTVPTSGVYVAVKSDANTGTLTATPGVSTDGYGDATNHGITANTATVGAQASDTTYIPITTTSASRSGRTVSYGSGWITSGSTSVPVGTVTSASTTIDSASFAYNSTNGNFDVTGSKSIGAPSVDTAGYISSSEGTRNGNTASLATTVDKIVGSTSITGTTTKKPSITKRNVPSGVIQAASGSATTTAPTSGVYVAVKSDANTGTITATPSVTISGYGTADNHGITGNSATVGASASDTTYIPITTTTASVNGKTVSYGSGWITAGSNSVALGTVTSGSATIDSASFAYNSTNGNFDITGSKAIGAPSVGTAGYISSSEGTRNENTATLAATAPKIAGSISISGTKMYTPSISKQAISISGVTDAASGSATTTAPTSGVYVAVKSAKNSGNISAGATISTAGYGTSSNHEISGSGNVEAGANASAVTYVPITTTSASISGKTVSYGSGWIVAGQKSVADGTISASVSSNAAGAASMAATGFTAASSATSYYVTLSTNPGSVKAKATVSTEGYVTSSNNDETAATSVAVSGNGTKLYIPAGGTTMNDMSVASSTGVVTATATVTTGYQAGSTPSKTYQLSTQAAKTVTPTESTQTAVAAGKYTTGAVKVGAISSAYVGSAITRNDSDSLSASAATVTAPAGYYAEDATFTMTSGSVTQNAPTINSSTGVVSANSTMTAGYIAAGTTSDATLQLTTQAAQTITPGTSNKTIAAGKYLTGIQTISGDANLVAGNIRKGSSIFGVSGSYSTVSGKTALTAAALRSGYAGFANGGSQINGSMPDTSVTEGTTSVSGTTVTRGTWSQTAGYTAARTISAASFANSATSGKTYVDISATTAAPVLVSGDYLYINKGYTDDIKISLAKLVPDNVGSVATFAGSDHVLSGYVAFNADGTGITGTIPTKTDSDLSASGKTVTVPAGYYAQQYTKNVATGTVVASVSSNSNGSASMSATGFTASTSATDYYVTLSTSPGSVKAKAAGGNSGYITSSTTNETSATNVAVNGNGTKLYIPAASIAGSSTNATATTTVAPGSVTIANNTTDVSGKTRIDSGVTTSTSGISTYYMAIQASAAANSTGTTSSISGSGTATVSTAGYAPSTLTGSVSVSGTATAKTSKKNSSVYYIPLTSAVAAANTASASIATASTDSTSITLATTQPSSGNYYTLTASGSGSSKITTAGWIPTGALTAASTTAAYYVTKATSSKTDATVSYTASAGTASIAKQPSASATATANGMDGGYYTDSTTSSYYVDCSASAASGYSTATGGSARAQISAASATVSAGYNPAAVTTSTTAKDTGAKTGNTATSTEVTASESKKIYLKAAGISWSGGGLSNTTNYSGTPTVSLSIDSQTTSGIEITDTEQTSGYYVKLTGSTAKMTGSTKVTRADYKETRTAGYLPARAETTILSSTTSSPSVTVNAATKTRYLTIPAAVIAGSSTNATATTTVAPGTVSISKQSTPSGVTNAASGAATTTAPTSGVYVAVKATAAANSTGTTSSISGSGTATVTTAGYASTTLTGSITVSGTATAKTSAKDSSMTYVPITTATPTFSSPTPTGSSTATSSQATITSTAPTDGTDGVQIQTKYAVNAANFTYSAAVNGWVTKSSGAAAGSTTARSATNSTLYYITKVTVPKDKKFNVETTADTALDTTSDIVVTNNAYRRINASNAANGTILVSNTGITEVTSASTSAGKVTIKAKVASGDSETTNQDVVVNGLWKNNSVSASGTYYGRTVVGAGSATTPATTITSSPSISVNSSGLITATNNKTQSVTPTVSAGYVASGTAGTITVSGSNTSQLTVQAAQTITPTTTDQTIASGKYLTGTQTIKGDANLIASNIKNGVTIFGITGTHKGYTVTESTDTNGGTIVNITTEGGDVDTYSWLGMNAELLQTFTAVTGNLSDTTFPSWTASTSAATIKATTNLTTFTADMANYEYIILWKCTLNVAYNSGATLKVTPKKVSFIGINALNRRPGDRTSVYASNFNAAANVSDTYWIEEYYNGSGTLVVAYSPSYGFYFGAPTPTFANATANSTAVTVKTPTISVRCHTTYFNIDRKAEVDAANSPYTFQGYLYRIKKNGSFRNGMVTELVSLHNSIT